MLINLVYFIDWIGNSTVFLIIWRIMNWHKIINRSFLLLREVSTSCWLWSKARTLFSLPKPNFCILKMCYSNWWFTRCKCLCFVGKKGRFFTLFLPMCGLCAGKNSAYGIHYEFHQIKYKADQMPLIRSKVNECMHQFHNNGLSLLCGLVHRLNGQVSSKIGCKHMILERGPVPCKRMQFDAFWTLAGQSIS